MRVAQRSHVDTAAVDLPASFVVAPPLREDPAAREYARLRAELDHVLETLLLHPPRHEHAHGPFAREYEALAERRRVLTAEVSLLERQMGKKPRGA